MDKPAAIVFRTEFKTPEVDYVSDELNLQLKTTMEANIDQVAYDILSAGVTGFNGITHGCISSIYTSKAKADSTTLDDLKEWSRKLGRLPTIPPCLVPEDWWFENRDSFTCEVFGIPYILEGRDEEFPAGTVALYDRRHQRLVDEFGLAAFVRVYQWAEENRCKNPF